MVVVYGQQVRPLPPLGKLGMCKSMLGIRLGLASGDPPLRANGDPFRFGIHLGALCISTLKQLTFP